MKSFWLVGIEGQVYYCVGLSQSQGHAFVREHNAFYKDLGWEDMAHLEFKETDEDVGYWADCGRFAILDSQFNFHRLHIAPSQQMPHAYGKCVYPEGVVSWADLQELERTNMAEMLAEEAESDGKN